MAHSTSSPVTDDAFTAQDAWDALVHKDDRTSPEEYPDMCLITFEELQDYIIRASQPATPTGGEVEIENLRDALRQANDEITHLHKRCWDYAAQLNATPTAMAQSSEGERYKVDDPWCRPAPSSAGIVDAAELLKHWQRAADKLQNDLRTSGGFDTRASDLVGKTLANVRHKTESALTRDVAQGSVEARLAGAEKVIRGVVNAYPVAAGISKYGHDEDHDGYGWIRECRLWLDATSSLSSTEGERG